MHEMLWYDHSNVTLSAILLPGTIFSWSVDLFFTHAILTFSMTAKVLCKRYGLSQAGGGGGGWGVLQISSDRDDRMEAKIKPKNIPRASNETPKNPWTKI